MAPRGSVYPLSVSFDNLVIPYVGFLMGQLRIIGSVVADRQVHKDMLEFAAQHKIQAIIEQFPLNVEGITEAMTKLEAGKMRYRAVLVAQ